MRQRLSLHHSSDKRQQHMHLCLTEGIISSRVEEDKRRRLAIPSSSLPFFAVTKRICRGIAGALKRPSLIAVFSATALLNPNRLVMLESVAIAQDSQAPLVGSLLLVADELYGTDARMFSRTDVRPLLLL